mmetsp:Transcript_9593/g.12420  ORF Transcript_9593/g.12420 Transcript_9593/m.12420 type:complete len:443 (+) Transcript_9593:292-1620(+)
MFSRKATITLFQRRSSSLLGHPNAQAQNYCRSLSVCARSVVHVPKLCSQQQRRATFDSVSDAPPLPRHHLDTSSVSLQRQQQRFKSSAAATATSQVDCNHIDDRSSYNVSQTLTGPNACRSINLDKSLGIFSPNTVYRNLTFQELFEHEQNNNEGIVANAKYGPTFSVDTGKFTGRSPQDKWIVRNPGSESEQHVDWGSVNQETSPEVFDELYDKAVKHMDKLDKIYVFDGFCGANPKSQKKVRFIHEMAWQQHFVTNMFIRPSTSDDLNTFEPDFTIINACSQVNEDWERQNLNSEVAVAFNIEKKCAVIFGTWYGGENKKGIFSLMNYWLPMSTPAMLPMHCSANVGKGGDTALFFGLSGTGKTTLSADPHRYLVSRCLLHYLLNLAYYNLLMNYRLGMMNMDGTTTGFLILKAVVMRRLSIYPSKMSLIFSELSKRMQC